MHQIENVFIILIKLINEFKSNFILDLSSWIKKNYQPQKNHQVLLESLKEFNKKIRKYINFKRITNEFNKWTMLNMQKLR